MHIVHIITTLQRGGAEACLANLLATWLSQQNDTHTVIYFKDGPTRQIIEQLGITCYQVSAPGLYANPLFFYKLLRKINKLKPDCLHTDLWAANLFGRIASKLLGIPCVSVIHIVAEHDGAIRALIDRLIVIKPYKYIAVSDAVRESYTRKPRYDTEALVTIPNGINAARVLATGNAGKSAAAHMLETSLGQQKFLIGAVGRLVDFKNYPLLIRSFAHIAQAYPQAQLVLVGSGPEEAKLRALTRELNVTERVTFIVGQQAVPYYQFFDCYVQPSLYEGLSIAVLEALCFSLPVIVTSTEDHHDIIIHEHNGLLVPSNNAEALSQALIQLIENKELRTKLGNNGYQTATTKFAIARTADAYHRLFREAYEQDKLLK